MTISPAGRERVTDAPNLMPVASMDVQSSETREFKVETLASYGDAVISQANAGTTELAIQPPEKTFDGRDWDTQYSDWAGNVLGGGKTIKVTPEEENRTLPDGRKFYGPGGYSTWNPYA